MGTGSPFWESGLFWNAVAAIAQVLIVFSIPTSIGIYWRQERHEKEKAQRQERLGREQFHRDERDKFYVQLDDMYQRILQMVVQNPKLRRASLNVTDDEKAQYDAFAFIVWNYIETIHDFCVEDEALGETWQCILESERESHAEWFRDPENRKRFKKPFQDYIDGLEARSADTRGGSATIS